ncbi:exported hypothetical protein [Capnocytophaga canimorsus]|uniref:Glucose/galactose transporter n=1 Tax=Capnocytophaga canimorsus TaxID=28188 RepID=A0A0B7HKY1_9FLAO|nr:hypothetical protein [Capnocytophaga canimorsus]CEN38547.1 exported hypothetical protein [Capnocytophaga canimorsus]
MSTKKQNFATALAFIGLMFFSIGFAFGINSYLIPVLKRELWIFHQQGVICF